MISPQATDLCTSNPQAVLVAATSNEADDAPGDGDGSTTDDITGADLGTVDLAVSLRAERAGTGGGRTYELRYSSVDAAGNAGEGTLRVQVPRDMPPGVDPARLSLELEAASGSMHIYWDPVAGAAGYDLLRGSLESVSRLPNLLSLGEVTMLASNSQATHYFEASGQTVPVGSVIFYVLQYRLPDGTLSGYGNESAGLPREPGSCTGGCPTPTDSHQAGGSTIHDESQRLPSRESN